METKGRRTSRVSGPVAAAPELPRPIDVPDEAENEVDSPTQAVQPAEPFGEAAKPAEIASDPEAIISPPSIATLPKEAKSAYSNDLAHFGRDAFAALTQSQTALARGLEALSAEMAGLALSGIDTAARAATKMLGIKTLSDAIDVNTGFACGSLDVLVGGSARISELGVKLAAKTSRPFLTQLGKGWTGGSRPST
jgi:hypothetical protein